MSEETATPSSPPVVTPTPAPTRTRRQRRRREEEEEEEEEGDTRTSRRSVTSIAWVGIFVIAGLMVLLMVFALVAVVMGAWVAQKTVDSAAGSDILVRLNPSMWVGRTYEQVQQWAKQTGRPARIARVNGFTYALTADFVANRVTLDLTTNGAALVAMTQAEALRFAQTQPAQCTVTRVHMG